MTFTATASFSLCTPGNPVSRFVATAYCVDLAAADALAATFPKSLRAKARRLGGLPGFTGIVTFEVSFSADGVKGDKNETGLKRLRRFMQLAGSLDWRKGCLNGYATEADFLAALA